VKTTYVRVVRALRGVLDAVGVLALLDRAARRSRTALWVRSWFAVYDLGDLLPLDVPWWTFASADRVEALLRDRPGARVFEWGSGASTVWLARRAASVTSVEHDPAWARRVAPMLPGNVALRVVEPGPVRGEPGEVRSAKPGADRHDFRHYVDAIDTIDAGPGGFDLIVIDGRAREACLDRAVERLAAGGMIVLDNVDRARYRDALARHGDRLTVTWTRGRTPALPYPTRTALARVVGTAGDVSVVPGTVSA
jgi:hypothetical protein